MTIYLNNQPLEIPDTSTLYHVVLARFNGKKTGFAVAVNRQVISRSEHKDYRLQPNDHILIIKATQGG